LFGVGDCSGLVIEFVGELGLLEFSVPDEFAVLLVLLVIVVAYGTAIKEGDVMGVSSMNLAIIFTSVYFPEGVK